MTARVKVEAWTFISGATAVAETRLLTNDEFLDLLRLPALAAVFQRIKQVETYVHLSAPESPDDATRAVEEGYLALVRRYVSETPDPRVGEPALLSRTFGELRAFLRERLFDEKRRREPVFLSEAMLEAAWNDSFDAPAGLGAAVSRVRAGLDRADDPKRLVDLLLDREELVRLGDASRALGSPWIARWAEGAVRLKAALVVVRARLSGEEPGRLAATFLKPPLDADWLRALAAEDANHLGETFARELAMPTGDSGTLSRATLGRLARNIDDRLTADMREAKYVAFGPERPFGYLWALHIENLNLRLITETFVVPTSRDRDEARARLRQSYV